MQLFRSKIGKKDDFSTKTERRNERKRGYVIINLAVCVPCAFLSFR